jgi:hypothetical protein
LQFAYCCAKPKKRVAPNPTKGRTLAKLRVEGYGEDLTGLLFQSRKKRRLMSQFMLIKAALT